MPASTQGRMPTLSRPLTERIPFVILAGYAIAVVLFSFSKAVGYFDAAFALVHASLIRQGQTPNVDFYSFYPPLVLYLTAASFRLLGQTIIATRLLAGLLFVIVLWLSTRFFKSQFPESASLVPLTVLIMAASIGTG